MSLLIQLIRNGDGTAELALVRSPGGNVQLPLGPADGFGPAHDLALYAVECELGLRHGFYGRAAEGVAIGHLHLAPGASSAEEVVLADAVAGVLAREAFGRTLSVEGFNFEVGAGVAARRSGVRAPALPGPLVERLRTVFASLRRRWEATGPGGMMELHWT
ncbi:MAG: hypothetical protein ACREL4_09390 [Gemmatimonadales bacterium]